MRLDRLEVIINFLLALSCIYLMSCSDHAKETPPHGEVGVAVAPSSISGNSLGQAGSTTPVSGGPNQKGVLTATRVGIVARLENGLESNALSTIGNFRKSLGLVKSNLPTKASVLEATGFDQVELLAFAACSDLTTGTKSLMESVYGINPAGTIASNQVALVAAGMRMLDHHTAGLASQGPDSAAVSTVLTNLVIAQAAVGTNTSKMAFMTVCIAANTAGTSMLGL